MYFELNPALRCRTGWPWLLAGLILCLLVGPARLLAQPGTLQFKSLSFTGREGGPAAIITVSRVNGSTDDVTVDFFTEDGTATANSDYIPTNGTLIFGPGVLSQTFTVPLLDDAVHELSETVTLQLTNAGGGAIIGAVQNATLTITDNDSCLYSLTPLARTHGPEAGSGSFILNAKAGCPWFVTESASWLGVVPLNGAGSNEVVYYLDSNPSTQPRSAVLRVAGLSFTVTQRGVPPPDLTRPVLAITAPVATVRVTNLPLVVSGRASDVGGVTLVEYRVENSLGTNAWQPASGTSNWMVDLPEVPPGANTVRLRATDTSGNVSAEIGRTFNFVVVSPLTLSVQGDGTVTPDMNGRFLDVGRMYTITAAPRPLNLFSNWTGDITSNVPQLVFRMATNLQLQANFVPNPFRPVRGLYNGLFLNAGPARHESSGFFTATTTDLGAYSAKLTLAGQVIPLSGRFALDGWATNAILRTGLNPVTVILHLEFADPRGYLSGSLNDGNWSADLRAHRAIFNAVTNRATQTGRYTLHLAGDTDPARAPAGTSIGAIAVDAAGRLTLAGTLADGTPIAQKVSISPDGEWPMFARLYNGGGELIGWENFSELVDRDVDGTAVWNKPTLAGALYTNGFSFGTTLSGARYQPPTSPLDFVLGYTNLLATFSYGNLETPFANALHLKPGNIVANFGTNRLTMAIALPTGLFNGTVSVPGASQILTFKGALHSKADVGAGFFPGTTQGGRVALGPNP